jgi:ubiquinone/menaquinone biosynthesis C-methylase UbiE
MFVEDLKKTGYTAEGYDLYNSEFNERLPEKNKFHVVTMIEVIEHTSAPYVELDVIFRSLMPGGILIVETSFVDVAREENIPLDEFHYVAPEAGHATIFSHHSLDLLMCKKGFLTSIHFNRHVRCYNKPISKK